MRNRVTYFIGLAVPPVLELAPQILLGPHPEDLLHVDVLHVGGADHHRVDDGLEPLVGIAETQLVDVPPEEEVVG